MPVITFVVIAGGLFGLLIGSFLNVVIYRIPAGLSISTPPSACTRCGGRIRPWDNVPVLSWLVLGGKCRDCSAPISPRYPLVELATGVSFAAVTWWMLSTAPAATANGTAIVAWAITLAAFLYLCAISIALALIDLDTHTLPNRIIYPAYLVSAVLLTVAALLAGEPARLFGALVGGAGLFALYLALALIRPGGMGLGDVKLAGVLGLYLGWLGWGELAIGAFAAFLLGGLFGVVLLAVRRAGRKSSIPFGPWMLAGAWTGVLFGNIIALGYLRLYGFA
ncbi:prepilin peptidase [Cryobacterium sp. 1639]|uniref:prepilin peptidase n=1 Tax=Cryobacterium inferilacus TaxID=2866629 RepID=UPI001C72D676|nr:A24 family peptidase [Cryobacterium sp. 1639]MBX0301790.1 prepilin peptidase [Cryobacterium sp. 1639]